MRKRLILNDIRKNRLFTAATVAFMTVSAMLFALTVLLSVSLLSSIQTLMEQAETPDFLQMHAGTVKEEEISAFAEAHPEVEEWQVMPFLNLENSKISLESIRWRTVHRIMDCPCRGRALTIWSILPMNFPKFGRVRSLSRSVTGHSMNLRRAMSCRSETGNLRSPGLSAIPR